MNWITALKRAALAAALIGVCGGVGREANAALIQYTNTGSATAWYTAASWSPSTAAGAWTTADIAQFNNTGTATITGINMATAQLSIGAIEVTSARTRALTIGNSSGTVGTLTLNGATINSIPNTILAFGTNSAVTLQNNDTGTGKTMNIALANTTDNVVQIDGTASHTISSVISGVGKHLTVQGTSTGRVILTGANTFTGGATIKAGGTISTTGVNSTGVGPVTSGPLGTGTLVIDGGRYIPSSSGINTISNNIDLTNTGVNSIAAGGTTTLNGSITGLGGFRKGSGGTIILTGTNSYAGVTQIEDGTVAFANRNAFYGANTLQWTDTNLVVGALVANTATAMFAVGTGPTDFTLAEWQNLATLGTTTTGFLDLGSIGIDTTNAGGAVTLSTPFTNTNAGANRLGLAKTGTNNLVLSAANTHGGPTTAASGAIHLQNQLAVQNSTLTLVGGSIVFDQSVSGNAFTAGGLAGTGNLALLNNAGVPAPIALTVGGNNMDSAYSGVLSGAGGSLTKNGTGALTLSVGNSYSGGTTLNGGKLNINHNSALGTGALTINGGAIDNTSGATVTVAGAIPISLNGNFTFSGSRLFNTGTGPITLGSNVQISLPALGQPGLTSANTAIAFGGVVGDGGNARSITTTGIGRVIFSSNQNTFSGGVTINGGVVTTNELGSNLGAGTGPLGTGQVTVGNGQLILASVVATVNTLENGITLTGTPATSSITTNGTSTLSGVIGGAGGFTKTGSGTLILSNANTFNGTTTHSSAGLRLSNQLALQNSTLDIAASTTLAFDQSVGASAFTLGGLNGAGSIALQNNATNPVAIALSVGNNNTNTNYTGVLSGSGSLTKIGSGILALSNANANTYTGTTDVNSGTLRINGAHTGGGLYTVNGGTLGGIGSTTSSVVVNSGGNLAPGNSPGLLSIGGSLTMGGSFDWELGLLADSPSGIAGTNWDETVISGNLTLGAGSSFDADFTLLAGADVPNSGNSFWEVPHAWLAIDVAGTTTGNFTNVTSTHPGAYPGAYFATVVGDGASSIDTLLPGSGLTLVPGASDVYLVYVPEPSTYLLVGIGMAGLAMMRKKRNS